MTTLCSFLLFLLAFFRSMLACLRFPNRVLWGSLMALSAWEVFRIFGNGDGVWGAIALSLVILLLAREQSREHRARSEKSLRLSELEKRLRDLAEEKDRLSRAYRLRRTLDYLSSRAQEETAFLHEVCHALVHIGIFRMVWIGEPSGDRLLPLAQAGYEKGYLEGAGISLSEKDERGRGPSGTSFRTGRPVVVQNLHTDPSFAPWREEAERRGYASVLALPLGKRILTLYAMEPQAFGPDEIALMTELAEIIQDALRRLSPSRVAG